MPDELIDSWENYVFPGVSKNDAKLYWNTDPVWQRFVQLLGPQLPVTQMTELDTYIRDHSVHTETPYRIQCQVTAFARIQQRKRWNLLNTLRMKDSPPTSPSEAEASSDIR